MFMNVIDWDPMGQTLILRLKSGKTEKYDLNCCLFRPTMQSSTTTDSSEVDNTGKELPVDEYGRINPYVDFAPFWKLWNQRQDSQTSLSGSEKNQ